MTSSSSMGSTSAPPATLSAEEIVVKNKMIQEVSLGQGLLTCPGNTFAKVQLE